MLKTITIWSGDEVESLNEEGLEMPLLTGPRYEVAPLVQYFINQKTECYVGQKMNNQIRQIVRIELDEFLKLIA